MESPLVVRHTYTKHAKGAKRSLGYYIHRPRNERGEDESREPYTYWDGEKVTLSRQAATDLISTHQQAQPLYHRFVLSPADYERTRDLSALVAMETSRLETKKGINLDWVAVEHRNTAHPHVHVIISGWGTAHDTGQITQVRFDKQDYQDLREWGHEWCIDLRDFHERDLPEDTEPKNRQLSREEAKAYRSDTGRER